MSRIEIFKYLRWILVAASGAMALLCLGLAPYIAWHPEQFFPELSLPLWWLLPAFYSIVIPVLIGIGQAFIGCGKILRDNAFSEEVARRLLNISRCALVDLLLLVLLGIALLITELLYPWLFIFLVLLLFAAVLAAVLAAVFAGMIRQKLEEQMEAQKNKA